MFSEIKFWLNRHIIEPLIWIIAFWWNDLTTKTPEPLPDKPVDPLIQQYADYMTKEKLIWEQNHPGQSYEEYEEHIRKLGNHYVGTIPHDWLSRINDKIEKENANERKRDAK